MPLIRLLGKKIGFALPENHATMELIFEEIKKLKGEGADLYPLLLHDSGPPRERMLLEDELYSLTGKEMVRAAWKDHQKTGEPSAFDLMVIAPCPGNMLMKILDAAGDPDTMVKALTHLQTDRPIVLALVANGNCGDLVRHIEQLLALKRIYLVPFGPTHHQGRQFIITRMDLIMETVVHAFMKEQIQPVIFEHHWLPS